MQHERDDHFPLRMGKNKTLDTCYSMEHTTHIFIRQKREINMQTNKQIRPPKAEMCHLMRKHLLQHLNGGRNTC